MEGTFNVTSDLTRREFTYTTATGEALAGAYSADAGGSVSELTFSSAAGFGGSFAAGGASSLWGVPEGEAASCGSLADGLWAAAVADAAERAGAETADGSGDDGEAEAETA